MHNCWVKISIPFHLFRTMKNDESIHGKMRDRIIGIIFFSLLCLVCCWRLVFHVWLKSSKDRIVVHAFLAIACLSNGLRHAHLPLNLSWQMAVIGAATANQLLFCCVCHVVYFWNRTINEGTITRAATNVSLYPLLFATIVSLASTLIFVIRSLQTSAPDIKVFIQQPVYLICLVGLILAFAVLLGTTIFSAWQLRKRMKRHDVNRKSIRVLTVAVFGIVFAYLTLGMANAFYRQHHCIYFTLILPFGSIVVCNLYLLRRVKQAPCAFPQVVSLADRTFDQFETLDGIKLGHFCLDISLIR